MIIMVKRDSLHTLSNKNFLLIILLFTLVLVFVPTLQFIKNTPIGSYYSGVTLFAPPDANVYLSAIKQGQTGQLLFSNRYNSLSREPLPLVYFPYLFVGFATRGLNISVGSLYQIMRLVSALIFPVGLWYFIQTFIKKQRQIVFLCTYVFMGMGWMGVMIGKLIPHVKQVLEICNNACASSNFWIPESTNLPILFTAPHTSLAVAFLLVNIALIFQLQQRFRLGKYFQFTLTTILAALFHQYTLIIIVSVFVTTCLYEWLKNKERTLLVFLCLGLLTFMPLLAFFLFLFIHHPVMIAWQGRTLLFPFVTWKIFWSKSEFRFLIIYVLINSILLYMPVAPQRRFSMGLFAPIGVLGSVGLTILINKLRNPWRWVIFTGMVSLGLIDFIFINVSSFKLQALERYKPDSYVYYTKYEDEGFHYLALTSAIDETVLSLPRVGNLIPVFAGNFVYLGHWAQTPEFWEKHKEVEMFLRGEIQPQQEFLKARNIQYVWIGAEERKYTNTDIFNDSSMQLVFQNPEVEVYRLKI